MKLARQSVRFSLRSQGLDLRFPLGSLGLLLAVGGLALLGASSDRSDGGDEISGH